MHRYSESREQCSAKPSGDILPIQILDLDTGEIVQRDFPITRETCVGDVTQKLQEIYPGYFIRLKNQLLKLRDEQNIANVRDTEDIFTAFIKKEMMLEEEDTHDYFVVIQCPTSKRRLFLTPVDLSNLDLHSLPYSQQIALCSKEYDTELEGETVVHIQKYDLYQHKNANEFEIGKTGVLKKDKRMRSKEKIISYGDEKEMLEGDFYKPEKPTSPFFISKSSIMFHNKTGQTIDILTGRSSSFEVSRLGSEEAKILNLQENLENKCKFGLVTDFSKLPDNPAKTYKADWYNLGKVDAEMIVEIEKTQSGLQVSRKRNEESRPKIIWPQMKPKFFIESEKNTDTNWRSFMKRRRLYRQEGPIFLSYTKVRGNKTFLEFREELKSLVENRIISSDAVVLILSGSHGDQEGKSALTDMKRAEYKFYIDDCESVGVRPEKDWADYDRPLHPLNIPKFYLQKKNRGFLHDEQLKSITFRVANITDYLENEETLVDHINECDPDVIMLGWCYSLNGDVSMVLRSEGVFSLMILNNDLRIITSNPLARLNDIQRQVIEETVERKPETCLFVWGSAGTGKTLILMEALKIKLSKLHREGKRVRILATTYGTSKSELQKKYVSKYLVNMKDVEVMDFKNLAHKLKINHDSSRPLDTVNKVIRSLSKSRNQDVTTFLLIDEVWSSGSAQQSPDWSDLEVRENVVWLLGLSPNAYSASSTEVLPPENSSVLTRQLVHKHRNCPQIRTFYKYFVAHHQKNYLSMDNDQELRDDQLPPGQAPVWIEPPKGVTQVEKLVRVEENIPEEYSDVMVLYENSANDRAAAWCKERGWQYHHFQNVTGCEAKCVVLLELFLLPERITRGINMLIIVNRKHDKFMLQLAVDHSDMKYQCKKISGCPYAGKTIIQKIPWRPGHGCCHS